MHLFSKKIIILIAGVLFATTGFLVYSFDHSYRENQKENQLKKIFENQIPKNKLSAQNTAADAVVVSSPLPIAGKKEKKGIKMLFVGDLMLDRYVEELTEKKGMDYFFEKILEKEGDFFSKYDLVGANLEGPVTNDGQYYDPKRSLDFAFEPEIVRKLKEVGFDYFTIANNHLRDQGEQGIVETRENLEKFNFLFSGCADMKVGECSVVYKEVEDNKIALIGISSVYGVLDFEKVGLLVEQASKQSDLTLVNAHWGSEYSHQPSNYQKKLAHYLIDSGADCIIGHHSHVVQGIEIYNEKPIFYSLGNFIFDQYFSDETQEMLALELEFKQNELKFNLIPLTSRQSQLSFMKKEKQNVFVRALSSWSNLPKATVAGFMWK